VDAFGDAEDLLTAAAAVRRAYVKPIIPGSRRANRNSVILEIDNVRLPEGGGDDDVVEFSAAINDDTAVDGFSEDGDDDQNVRFSVVDNVDQAVKFSARSGDDQEVGFSVVRSDDDLAFIRF